AKLGSNRFSLFRAIAELIPWRPLMPFLRRIQFLSWRAAPSQEDFASALPSLPHGCGNAVSRLPQIVLGFAELAGRIRVFITLPAFEPASLARRIGCRAFCCPSLR